MTSPPISTMAAKISQAAGAASAIIETSVTTAVMTSRMRRIRISGANSTGASATIIRPIVMVGRQ